MKRILLYLAFVCHIHFVRGVRDENTRSSYFNMMRHHRLTGHLITTTTADTELTCAHKCLRNEKCKSCNFKAIPNKIGICELNSRTLLSQTHDPALIHDAHFVFVSLEDVSFTPTITDHYCLFHTRILILCHVCIDFTIIGLRKDFKSIYFYRIFVAKIVFFVSCCFVNRFTLMRGRS